jgi:O-antigen ligase
VNSGRLKQILAVALFVTTTATIGVMWQPAFWATAVAEVMAYCLAAVCLICYFGGSVLQFNPIMVPLIVASLWPLVQLATGATIYRWNTLVSALYWSTNAAVVFVGLQIFSDANVKRWYLRALLIAAFVIAVISPLQLFTSEGKIFWWIEMPYSDVAMGPFVYANQYAAFIELVLPIALTGLCSDRSGWRTFHGLAAAVMYASIFASLSRTGFILTTLEILIVPLLAAKRARIPFRQVLVSGALFLGMLLVLGFAVGPDKLFQKLQQKHPYHYRQEYTESSLPMIRDNPIMGVGMGNWPVAYPAYAIFDEGWFANQAHNDWAQWAVEGGIPFALLILSLAIWSTRRAVSLGWGVGVPVVFLQCFVDYPIQRMGVAIVFFTLVAAIAYPASQDESPPERVPRAVG